MPEALEGDAMLDWLLSLDERLFLSDTTLSLRQNGRSFDWISKATGLSAQQIEAKQIAGLRCLHRNGVTREELAEEFRFTRQQIAHALGPDTADKA
jgi:hypothetical protein